MVVVHPNFIARIAGEPADLLACTATGNTAALIEEQVLRESAAQAAAAEAVLVLEDKVHGQADKTLRRALLSLKRMTHNLKPGRDQDLQTVRVCLSAEESQALDQAQRAITAMGEMGEQIDVAYERELAAGATSLPELWERRFIQLGLSYANVNLYRGLASLFAQPEKKIKPKKRRHLEDALLQFASRSSTKTSPLSFFTPVHVGSWRDDAPAHWAIDYDCVAQSRTEIKSGLVQQLVWKLLHSTQEIWSALPLEMNPSIRFDGSKIRFRKIEPGAINSGKTWGTGADDVELDLSPILKCVIHVYRSDESGAIFGAELVSAVCNVAPKLPMAAVEEFIKKLFDIGFLRCRIEPMEQVDALDWARAILEAIPGRRDEALAAVEQMRQVLQAFGSKAPASRAEAHAELDEAVERFGRSVENTVMKEMASPVFFENVYLTGAKFDRSEAALAPFLDEMTVLFEIAPLLDSNHRVRTQCADFFLHRYGDAEQLPTALEFLQEIDQVYAPGHADPGSGARHQQAPDSDLYTRLGVAFDAYEELIAKALRQNEDVVLDIASLKTIADQIPDAVTRRSKSFSYVGQLYEQDQQTHFVVNQVFGGRSSLFSRFLEVSTEDELQKVREYLTRSSAHGRFAEIPALFGFNANRHPRLSDHELRIAPYRKQYADAGDVDLAGLRVRFDAATHSVEYIDSNNEPIDLWYLGFLISPMLPQMQRLLTMCANDGLNFYALGAIVSKGLIDQDNIVQFPRVSLGNVTLSRRMWVFPRKDVPEVTHDQAGFFKAIARWRRQHDLPDEVFIRVAPVGEEVFTDPTKNVSWESLAFKDLKPFYVNFSNPRLVRLLNRVASKNDFAVTVAEVLPGLDTHRTSMGEGRPHVCELHFELSDNGLAGSDGL